MPTFIDFAGIVESAWNHYDDTRSLTHIEDISAKVSTNYVFRLTFSDNTFIIGKLSFFGQYEHFVEDHTIINALSNNLPHPFENVLSRALMKGNQIYIYRHTNEVIDAWVIFYRPIQCHTRLPRRLNEEQIVLFAEEMARFHLACNTISNTLPPSSKTLKSDIDQILRTIETDYGKFLHRNHIDTIKYQCNKFLENREKLQASKLEKIPIFIDWNIGNFSVNEKFKLFSRWDYDWFRISSRMLDFYFFSRVVSDAGDRTVFTYNASTMMEDRFILFLKTYHQIYPLQANEILFLKEAYRFFLLNYVVKDGRYFFHEIFATKLRRDVYEEHLPNLDNILKPEKILKALNL